MYLTKRDVALVVILSIITCGFYTLFWIVVTQDDLNNELKELDEPSGIMVLLLTIITCGIYGIYWYYKIGVRVSNLTGEENLGILNLVLCIAQLSIIGIALTQNALNKYIDRNKE